MHANPCLQCQRKNSDKNHRLCTQCKKRIRYVNQLEQTLNYALSYTEERSHTNWGMELN